VVDPRRQNVDGGVAMAARQRPGTVVGAGVTGKEPGNGGGTAAAGGGLSLSSTASNDTGYSSIGNNNSAQRPLPCWTAKTPDLMRPSGCSYTHLLFSNNGSNRLVTTYIHHQRISYATFLRATAGTAKRVY